MGDLWWLRVGDTQIQWGKNDEPAQVLSVFSEADKFVDQRWLQIVRDGLENANDRSAEDDAYLESRDLGTVFGYRTNVGTVVDRLELMGFTLDNCRGELQGILRYLNGDQSVIQIRPSRRGSGEPPDLVPLHVSDVLDRALAAWLAIQNGSGNSSLLDPIDESCLHELDFLDADFDRRALLAVQLQHIDPTTDLNLDLSELFQAGYFADSESIALLASERLAQQLGSTGPIVVVTEGKTDAELLQRTLAITVPTVSHLFRFLDFESKVEGSSDQVVRTLRSFSAAGVMNRVIGVLGNDVAGRKALGQLDSSKLLPSVHYFTLPDVAYAESYPTLGPDGQKRLNVNGRAVSVEFLFGLDCLKTRSGEPIPIRWTGFDAGRQEGSAARLGDRL